MELGSIFCQKVIDDVIEGVRNEFKNNEVGDSVLDELQRIWKKKLSEKNISVGANMQLGNSEVALPPQQKLTCVELAPNQQYKTQKINVRIKIPPSGLNFSVLLEKIAEFSKSSTTDNINGYKEGDIESALALQISNQLKECTKPELFKYKGIEQVDGPHDTSTETDSSSEEVEDYDMNESINDDQQGTPLNSDDDISENEDDVAETENILVCQFEKIVRRVNKWKFYLKSGVMNLNGTEYVFSSLTGETEW